MKRSLRNSANMLMGVGVMGLAWSFEPTPYVTDFGVAQSTASDVAMGVGWAELVNLVSVYLLFIAVGILIVLELFELHYLRALLRSRRKFSFK